MARDFKVPITSGGVVIPTVSSTSTLTNKTLTSPVVNSPTGIVKADVGLGNVDNTSDATERAATATLTNKTLTTPTIEQINNSAAPGVKLQLRTQTDNANSIASATTAGVFVQYGWGQSVGNNTASFADSVTFPTAFTTVLGVTISLGAAKSTPGAAANITGMDVEFVGASGLQPQWSDVTTSGFTANLGRVSGAFSDGVFYGYSWIAWGV